jgi:hypothetical protein
MTNRVFRIFFSVVLLLGLAAGYWLAALPGLQTNELLNLVGLSYNFLGVLVLSELLAVSATWKNICVKFLAPGVLWLHTLIPLGACVGGTASRSQDAFACKRRGRRNSVDAHLSGCPLLFLVLRLLLAPAFGSQRVCCLATTSVREQRH